MANSERLKDRARTLLRDFKGASYAFGVDVLSETGKFASELGKSSLVIANRNPWIMPVLDKVMDSLRKHGVTVVGEGVVRGSAPNSPREDVYRMAAGILQF